MTILKKITKYSTRIILTLFVLFGLGFFAYIQSTQIDKSKLTLVSEEKFEGTSLSDKWQLIGDGAFHYTGFYDNDQVTLTDGKLSIRLNRKEGDAGNQLYSSAVRSADTYTSGYFEVTATLPKVNEFNAVIALTSNDALINTDPSLGAKIVFASSNNHPYPLLATGIYYDNEGEPTETQNAFVMSLVYGESHHYGILWDKDTYSFYFDGYKLWESKATPTSTEPLYLTFGFEFPYYATQDITSLDKTFVIDSVKIYSINP